MNIAIDEHEIGIWVDGKKLYEITLSLTASDIPTVGMNNLNYVEHHIANIDNPLEFECLSLKTTDSETGNYSKMILQESTNRSYVQSNQYLINKFTRQYIQIRRGDDATDETDTIYLILRYTKTTDVPTPSQIVDTSDATAHDNHLLDGFTAYARGNKLSGTMPNIGDVSVTLNSGEIYYVPMGYHSGNGIVTASGGGILGNKTITENGIYNAADDLLDGYSQVNVQVTSGTYTYKSTEVGTIVNTFNTPILIEEGVTNAEYLCTSMANLNSPVSIPNTVTTCAYMFYLCANYNQPTNIPKSVTNCDRMFWGCSKFNQPVTIPNNGTNCYYMFNRCLALNQPITIPEGITYIRGMFASCSNYNQSTIIPSGVTDCADMFNNCQNYNMPITIPNSVVNCYSMFNSCFKLNSLVSIGNSVQHMNSMFYRCNRFNQPITIPDNCLYAPSAFLNCFNFNHPVSIPNTMQNCYYMFCNCYNFNQNVVLPENVVTCNSMFNGCLNLHNKTIELLATNYCDCSRMFARCNGSINFYVTNVVNTAQFLAIFVSTNGAYKKSIFAKTENEISILKSASLVGTGALTYDSSNFNAQYNIQLSLQ